MKVNELMTGDWVAFSSISQNEVKYWPGQIEIIENPLFKDDLAMVNLGTIGGYREPDTIYPLPLVREIFEDNFSNKFEDGLSWMPHGDGFYVNIRNKEPYGESSIVIKYVHELQHLLRLYKINKEIAIIRYPIKKLCEMTSTK